MSNLPNIGDRVAAEDGKSGAVFGLRETAFGVHVQFEQGGTWHPVAAASEPVSDSSREPPPAPAKKPAKSDPTDLPAASDPLS